MPERFLCDVYENMRKTTETLNFSYLKGLIEEAQAMSERIEEKLYEYKNINRIENNIQDIKTKKKGLKKELEEHQKEVKELEAELASVKGTDKDEGDSTNYSQKYLSETVRAMQEDI